MTRLLMICYIICLIMVSKSEKQKTSALTAIKEGDVSIVPDTEHTTNVDDGQSGKQDTINLNTPNDLNSMEAMNPQLIAALKKINDDPSYLQPKEGEVVDLSQFQMDPEKLEEMIEIFDWIESQLPPDDPQQIQNILNNVEQYIDKSDTVDANYTDDRLLRDLTILPEFLYQVDNGVDFMKMNGVRILLKAYATYDPSDENTNATLTNLILSQIMDVIGVATQNNPNAIQYAHQSNVVAFIVNALDTIHQQYKKKKVQVEGQLMNKLLFALSSVTRQSEIGLQHLRRVDGAHVLYKCVELLSKETDGENGDYNFARALKKLLTMVSDIVVLNRNNVEYSRMFLNSAKWCGFMIEKGFFFDTQSVLHFLDYGLQAKHCVEGKMLMSLRHKLKALIKQQNTNKNNEDADEEYFDEAVVAQAINMLQYIQNNFDYLKKTDL